MEEFNLEGNKLKGFKDNRENYVGSASGPASAPLFPCEVSSKIRRLEKQAVVVLTRLPDQVISDLIQPEHQDIDTEIKSRCNSEPNMVCEPGDDTNSQELSPIGSNQNSSLSKKNLNGETSPKMLSSSSNNTGAEGNSKNSSGICSSSEKTNHLHPDSPEKEIAVDMVVVARRRAMQWQRGKIVDILPKEPGQVKYKVSFEGKGKSLVSGHHIAFDLPPKLEELYVGVRVVVQSPGEVNSFLPGVLAELPSRSNHLRFLVFADDHTPFYVGLPSLHLVCRPFEKALDDIPDGLHRCFVKQYLNSWPYPQLIYYKPGQQIKVNVDGEQKIGVVETIDCSLILVVYQNSLAKEWIHRGSMRLEHVYNFHKTPGGTKIKWESL